MRAYATNSTGTGYGNEQIFQTDPAIVTDIDGNIYNVVRIGTQLWMKENLKATKNTDGTSIALVNTEFNWTNLTVNSKAYCWLNDNIINKDTYGALYTWAAAQEVCPAGWHLPVDDEWTTLITYSGGLDIAGNILKETGTTHWSTPNSATNITGFTALPGGGRDIIGSFWGAGYFGSWWTSTQADAENAWISSMSYISGYMQRGSRSKFLGQSVRCIKNTN
jgi:uncharacterized protein (TIGR02145 family)